MQYLYKIKNLALKNKFKYLPFEKVQYSGFVLFLCSNHSWKDLSLFVSVMLVGGKTLTVLYAIIESYIFTTN